MTATPLCLLIRRINLFKYKNTNNKKKNPVTYRSDCLRIDYDWRKKKLKFKHEKSEGRFIGFWEYNPHEIWVIQSK